MGAVFAGAGRAPITAVVIMFELTGAYTMILPLMLAIVLARQARATWCQRDTVYSASCCAGGIDIDELGDAVLRRTPITSIMSTPPDAVPGDATLSTAAKRFTGSGNATLPVVDDKGRSSAPWLPTT